MPVLVCHSQDDYGVVDGEEVDQDVRKLKIPWINILYLVSIPFQENANPN